ncbi:LacI family DNA-binding transcriptional regulator [Oceanobacillus sojae]|uniref:LacI family DNA-binding transcriptional regulator n=1 Tax=Oceanobacillus sojae TaxID=582851 RepID=UPI00098891B4|nr:LacI family DNA-binding transcriptional regulator [Oceanobacillus sojae]
MVTIKDIAKLANVSTATVSYVLNNTRPVHPDKEKKVREAIKELNYVPNSAARGLRSKKNQTIGLVITDITNPFYPNLAKGCQEVLKQNDYTLMMYNSDEQHDQISNVVRHVREGKLDGIILANLVTTDIDNLKALNELNFPTVIVHRNLKNINMDSVVVDNYSGAHAGTEHLIGLGHKNIIFFQGINESPVTIERKNGYIDAMKTNGLEPCIKEGKGSYQASYSQTLKLINDESQKNPTAIFASSDIMAFGVMDAVKTQGLSVPEDISVIGYDDLFMSSWNSIQLTTVRVPTFELGKQAARLLLRKMNNDSEKKNHLVLQTELIIRKTCNPL